MRLSPTRDLRARTLALAQEIERKHSPPVSLDTREELGTMPRASNSGNICHECAWDSYCYLVSALTPAGGSPIVVLEMAH